MRTTLRVLFGIGVLLAAGCASTAPRYEGNLMTVRELQSAELGAIDVNDFIPDPGSAKVVESPTIRGGRFSSPYGTFARYVSAALRQELERAGSGVQRADVVIDGVLQRNALNAAGVAEAHAEVEVKLTVQRNGGIAYQGVKSARHYWPSSLIGAVAIPRAIENYPVVVRKVLAMYYADPEFMLAIGP